MLPRPEISPWAVAGLCVLYYLDPADLFWPFFLSCAVHEAAHLLCALCFNIPLLRFEWTLLGARLHTAPCPDPPLLLCTLAGPVVNLLLGFTLLRLVPMFACCNLLLGCFNLLPFDALDGGQILQLLCKKRRLRHLLQGGILLVLLFFCAAAYFHGLRLPLMVCLFLLGRALVETAVAKRAQTR